MIRVLIIEDSSTVRRHLVSIFSASKDFEVVGAAATAQNVSEMVRLLRPDLVSLDVFLPGESAAAVVTTIRKVSTVPIVLVSGAAREAREVFEAMAAGALDFVTRPTGGDATASAFLDLMRMYSRVGKRPPPVVPVRQAPTGRVDVVVVGASTGGPPALQSFLAELGASFPVPVLIAQHLAAGFGEGLADWLTQSARVSVRIAEATNALRSGEVVLGRPGKDLIVEHPTRAIAQANDDGGLHPSADILFESAAGVFAAGVVAVVLTGMGDDGSIGARSVVRLGGTVMAQDRATSAVYGMPAAVARAKLASITGSPLELARILRARVRDLAS